MNLYKTRTFSRLTQKYEVPDDALQAAVEEMRKGIIHARLGGGLYKQRVALDGRGKRGGSRVLIAANLNDKWFFLYCFLKKDTDNLKEDEEQVYKALARFFLGMSEIDITKAIREGVLEVIEGHENDTQE